jgi:hypothetical protein
MWACAPPPHPPANCQCRTAAAGNQAVCPACRAPAPHPAACRWQWVNRPAAGSSQQTHPVRLGGSSRSACQTAANSTRLTKTPSTPALPATPAVMCRHNRRQHETCRPCPSTSSVRTADSNSNKRHSGPACLAIACFLIHLQPLLSTLTG